MYKVVVNVSGKRARVVPEAHILGIAEREFGDLSQEDALANRDGLTDAVRGLLAEKGVTDGDLYSVELPDELTPRQTRQDTETEAEDTASKRATRSKGPVTKPENPKEGEQNSPTNQPEQGVTTASAANQPSETEKKAPAADETKVVENTDKKG